MIMSSKAWNQVLKEGAKLKAFVFLREDPQFSKKKDKFSDLLKNLRNMEKLSPYLQWKEKNDYVCCAKKISYA